MHSNNWKENLLLSIYQKLDIENFFYLIIKFLINKIKKKKKMIKYTKI